MPTYKCVECEEEFEHKVNCIKHHLETKHEEFELSGTDAKFKIKS